MTLVPFLAVDNHLSSVVVGTTLICSEDADIYEWILRAFLRCHEKQPKLVITDQCLAMKKAIPLVFTETKHRLCMWHIMNKVAAKLSAALNHDAEFQRVINKLVWNVHIGVEQFEKEWQEMLVKYSLVDDKWFIDMYSIRSSWIPAYYRDTPMSGLMKTTSRSESSNAYINMFESYYFDLVQFRHNYDFSIEKQRYGQAVSESVVRTTNPHFYTPLQMEKQTSRIYTRDISFEIQKEIKKAVFFVVWRQFLMKGHQRHI